MANLTTSTLETFSRGKKRKNAGVDEDGAQVLEIDLNAPEPASKKSSRKAKQAKQAKQTESADVRSPPDGDEPSSADVRESPGEDATPIAKKTSGRSPYGIWLGNLAFFITKKDLEAFLTGDSEHVISPDEITRTHIPQGSPKPGSQFQNKGFAYIDFASSDVVERALQLSEKLLGGRRVLIKSSKDFQGRPDSTQGSSWPKIAASKRIFVGNLEFDVSKESLALHFETCGPTHDVHLATFEDSGKCKGYGWVEFEELASAEVAMRGWVEVGDIASNAEKENAPTEARSPKIPRKRIWVNRMGSRKLRMEFAEDKVTRYKKRFGKESQEEGAKKDDLSNAGILSRTGKNYREKEVLEKMAQVESTSRTPAEGRSLRNGHSSYPPSSVQKMKGAIVDGKGSKTVFE